MRRLRGSIVVLLAIAAGLALLFILFIRPPSWWEEALVADVERAARFEQGCLSEAHRVREPGEAWAIRVRDQDVNEWLAARFPKWCAHLGIEAPGAVQVRFVEGEIAIAVETSELGLGLGVPTVAVATFTPTLEGGRIHPGLAATTLGRLPSLRRSGPLGKETFDAIAEALRGAGEDPSASALAALLADGTAPAEFELADGRRVRLRDFEIHDGELLLEFETVGR